MCGTGLLPIVLHTDADVARAFSHKRGVRRMNYLDVRDWWLQEELRNGTCKVKRVDRKFNASDMLTHSPSVEELRKYFSMIGCHTLSVKKENFNAVKTMLKGMPAAKITAFLASMAETLNPWVAVANHFAADEFAYFEDSSFSDQVKAHLSDHSQQFGSVCS